MSFPVPAARVVRSYVTPDPPSRPESRRLLPHRRLRLLADRYPDKPAVTSSAGSYSYREFDRLVTRLASGLLALGVRRGEAVAIGLGNVPEHVAMYYAASRGGFAYAPLSRYLVGDEIDWLLSELGPRFVLGDVPTAVTVSVAEALAAGGDRLPSGPEPAESDLMSLNFSSGTTGRPKMFGRDQRLRELYAAEMALEFELGPSDVNLVVGPLAHAAMQIAVSNLTVGASLVIRDKFDAETFFADVAAAGATNVMLVPTMITRILDDTPPPCLRKIVSLGAPLTPELKRRMAVTWPGVGLYEMYGSTEAGMVTMLRPAEQLIHPESVGRASFLAEVAVFDEAGAPLAAGQLGDIYIRGPLAAAVLGSIPTAPVPELLRGGGWVGFGDLGELDDDGYLYLTGRREDLILSGALNVYPAEVERVLLEIPGVEEALVIGLDDLEWGQVVCAVIVGPVDEQVVADECAVRLAGYKRPRHVRKVPSLPRNANGKVSRRQLREQLNGSPGALPADTRG